MKTQDKSTYTKYAGTISITLLCLKRFPYGYKIFTISFVSSYNYCGLFY